MALVIGGSCTCTRNAGIRLITAMQRGVYVVSGGSPTVPSGLPSAAYYQRFVGCVDYVRLGTSSSAPARETRRRRLDLVADRDAHDTLAFCDDHSSTSLV